MQADTFEAIAREWLDLQSKSLAPETMEILGTRLKSFLYPYIGSRPVASITAHELLAALRRIEARGTHETAHRVRSLAGSITWDPPLAVPCCFAMRRTKCARSS